MFLKLKKVENKASSNAMFETCASFSRALMFASKLEDGVLHKKENPDITIDIQRAYIDEEEGDGILIEAEYSNGIKERKISYTLHDILAKVENDGFEFIENEKSFIESLKKAIELSDEAMEELEDLKDEDAYGTIRGLIDAIDAYDGEIKLYKNYSGRNMYGRECFGIVVDSYDSELKDLFVTFGIVPNQDGMGLSTILYWPKFKYEDILKEDKNFERRYKSEANVTKATTINQILSRDNTFKYQLLSRMQSDCEYFINRSQALKNLWAESVEEQIEYMKAIWNNLKEKPEWLSMKEIEEYERKMLDLEAY